MVDIPIVQNSPPVLDTRISVQETYQSIQCHRFANLYTACCVLTIFIITSCGILSSMLLASGQNKIPRCATADFKGPDGKPTGVLFGGVSSYLGGQNISFCRTGNCKYDCQYTCKVGWGHLKAVLESSFVSANITSQFTQPCVWCMGLGMMWSPGGNTSVDGHSIFPQPCFPCKMCTQNQRVVSPCSGIKDAVCEDV